MSLVRRSLEIFNLLLQSPSQSLSWEEPSVLSIALTCYFKLKIFFCIPLFSKGGAPSEVRQIIKGMFLIQKRRIPSGLCVICRQKWGIFLVRARQAELLEN
jgi:hypothetical protein